MRSLETLALLVLAGYAVALLLGLDRRGRGVDLLLALAALLILLHLWVEGARWQMIPAYALCAVALLGSWRAIRRRGAGKSPPLSRLSRLGSAVGALLLVGASAAGALALPVFAVPEPSGPYAVGTSVFALQDPSRPETIRGDGEARRELVVRAWYPAERLAAARKLRYMPLVESAAFARSHGLPGFVTSHLRLVRVPAFEDVAIAEAERPFPVLLFSHGYRSPPSTYARLLSEIASHGYVVLAVSHTYEALVTIFPDGRVAHFDDAFAEREHVGVWERIAELEPRYWAAPDDPGRRRVLREITDTYRPMAAMLRRWAADLSFVLDELERGDPGSPLHRFSGRVDLGRTGMLGHSTGGAAAGQLMLSDSRIRAGLNWDGAQWGDVLDSTLVRPFMRIDAVRNPTAFAPNYLIYEGVGREVLYAVMVDGIGHSSFSDIPYIVPIRGINEAGPMDFRRATEIVAAYTLAFFAQHLSGVESPLLTGDSTPYAEVEISASRPPLPGR